MWLLKGGRVLCPASGLDARLDVRVVGDRITALGPDLPVDGATVLAATGLVVAPAFVDLACELGDPGQTWREDLHSGSRAAAAGGYGTVVASPATEPPIDVASVAADVVSRASRVAGARILVAGALTEGLLGRELAEMNDLVEAGCVALSDGARAMGDALVLRNALEYARALRRPVLLRPGEPTLEERGCMHEGVVSTTIGLHGIPPESEEIGLSRILALARLAGVRVHLTHLTTARSLALLRAAVAEGLPVTASVPARHLVLTDAAVDESGYDPNTRLLPPLRPESDRAALVAAVRAGELQISADHVPWSRVEKEHEFIVAVAGAVGLETAFAAALTALGDLRAVVAAMAVAPGRVLGLDPRIAIGAQADLVVLSEADATVGSRRASRGCNEPLQGRTLRGVVRATLVGGKLAYTAGGDVIA